MSILGFALSPDSTLIINQLFTVTSDTSGAVSVTMKPIKRFRQHTRPMIIITSKSKITEIEGVIFYFAPAGEQFHYSLDIA
jgi:hypothetical protein